MSAGIGMRPEDLAHGIGEALENAAGTLPKMPRVLMEEALALRLSQISRANSLLRSGGVARIIFTAGKRYRFDLAQVPTRQNSLESRHRLFERRWPLLNALK